MHNTKINWDDQKEKLKERFSSLTDKDLNFDKGKIEDMIINLQNKVGKTRHELYGIIARH